VPSCSSCGFAIAQEGIACSRCGNRTIVPAELDTQYQEYKNTAMEAQREQNRLAREAEQEEMEAQREQNRLAREVEQEEIEVQREKKRQKYFEKRLEHESLWEEKWDMNWSQKYFSFEGRLNRERWWTYSIVGYFVSAVYIMSIAYLLGEIFTNQIIIFTLFAIILISPVFYFYVAITIKRLKDSNRGWNWGWLAWALVVLSCLYFFTEEGSTLDMLVQLCSGLFFWILLLICGFVAGTKGPNQYGSDPLMKNIEARTKLAVEEE